MKKIKKQHKSKKAKQQLKSAKPPSVVAEFLKKWTISGKEYSSDSDNNNNMKHNEDEQSDCSN